MNNVRVLINKSPIVTYWRSEKTGKPARDKYGNIEYDITAGGEGILSSLVDMRRTIDGDYGVKHLLHGIESVKIGFHDDVSNIPGYYTMLNCPREDLIDSEETRSWDYSMIPYSWSDGEVYFADSWKDVTMVVTFKSQNEIDRREFYSTPEVIEVLEKWIEALERWNNPEERKKMIEAYERDHTEEK